jgi:hypothetical protein
LELAQTVSLPQSLESVKIRADLINKVNNQLSIYINKDIEAGSKTGQLHSLDNDNRQQLFEDIIQIICKYECNWAVDKNNLLSVAFRLWAGCLSAAKTIAQGTRDGENTAAPPFLIL